MQIDGWNPKDIGYDTGYNHTYGVGTDTDAKSTGAADGSKGECQTCKNRKYQDGSNENVSFKSASHISPEAAGIRVAAHEAEHVSNAYAKGEGEDYSHYFERFYRGDSSHDSTIPGYGIGLSMAKEMVALLDGQISVSYKDHIITYALTFEH